MNSLLDLLEREKNQVEHIRDLNSRLELANKILEDESLSDDDAASMHETIHNFEKIIGDEERNITETRKELKGYFEMLHNI